MTPRQRGAYWHLCCISWRSTPVARLLNDPLRLARLSGLTDAEWVEDCVAILRAFRVDADGYITQKRLEREWEKQVLRRAQTAEAGTASAIKRGQSPMKNRRSTQKQSAFNERVESRSTQQISPLNDEKSTAPTSEPSTVQPLSCLSLTEPNLLLAEKSSQSGELKEPDPEPSKRFKPPTLDEVKSLAIVSGLPENEAVKFYYHYEKCGWTVGRSGRKMKSLSGAIAHWKVNYEEWRQPSNNGYAGQRRTDGNVGTLNEGKSSQYRNVGKVAQVPDAAREAT